MIARNEEQAIGGTRYVESAQGSFQPSSCLRELVPGPLVCEVSGNGNDDGPRFIPRHFWPLTPCMANDIKLGERIVNDSCIGLGDRHAEMKIRQVNQSN